MEKLITRKEAAKILGISLTTLDEARNSGLHCKEENRKKDNQEGCEKGSEENRKERSG